MSSDAERERQDMELSTREVNAILARRNALRYLAEMTKEQRLEVFAEFCMFCGSRNDNCICMKDE